MRTHATVSVADRMHPLTRTVLTTTRTADGWTVDTLRVSPVKDGDKHYMTLIFTGTSGAGMLDITAGKKAKIAAASLETGGTAADNSRAIKFTSPAWVAGKQLAEQTTATPDTLTTAAK